VSLFSQPTCPVLYSAFQDAQRGKPSTDRRRPNSKNKNPLSIE